MSECTLRLQLKPQQEFTMKPFDRGGLPVLLPRLGRVRQACGASVGPSARRKTLSLLHRDTADSSFPNAGDSRCPRLGDTRAWEERCLGRPQLATCYARRRWSHLQRMQCKRLHAQTLVTCWAPVSPGRVTHPPNVSSGSNLMICKIQDKEGL